MLFGGNNDYWSYNDLWIRTVDVGPWQQLLANGPAPASHSGHTTVLDAVRDRMVVFGGTGTNEVSMLTFTPVPTWTYHSLSGPPVRSLHSAIMDASRNRMIVFGGVTSPNTYRNDLWQLGLSGTLSWSPLIAAGTPPTARMGHSAVYDSNHDRMIVFGGAAGNTYYEDVWVLTLSGAPSWIQLVPSGAAPPGRYGHAAFYDPAQDRMVVFGGYRGAQGRVGDVWALSLGGTPTWTELAPSLEAPHPRMGPAAVLDLGRRAALVFGGSNASGGTGVYFDELWALELEGVVGVEPTSSGEIALLVTPNPVRGEAHLAVTLPNPSRGRIQVVDVQGRRVATLSEGAFAAGTTHLRWDCRDALRQRVSSGVYRVVLDIGGHRVSRAVAIVD